MPEFNAPLRDMRFVLHDVFQAPSLWARLPALAETVDADTADAILEEAAKVTGTLIAPLNRSGDEEGAQWQAGEVRTPAGFREAYATYTEGGWVGLSGNPEYGGMGAPFSVATLAGEVLIAVEAAGVNGHDVHQLHRGGHALEPGETDLPGLEVSGEIVATGEGVARWQVGDRVCALLRGGVIVGGACTLGRHGNDGGNYDRWQLGRRFTR